MGVDEDEDEDAGARVEVGVAVVTKNAGMHLSERLGSRK